MLQVETNTLQKLVKLITLSPNYVTIFKRSGFFFTNFTFKLNILKRWKFRNNFENLKNRLLKRNTWNRENLKFSEKATDIPEKAYFNKKPCKNKHIFAYSELQKGVFIFNKSNNLNIKPPLWSFSYIKYLSTHKDIYIYIYILHMYI